MSELISVIVPVYNIENYIEKCVESILNQTYVNFELILVDDGSTDKTGIICDKYEKDYDNIHVIHKQNGGQNSARRDGLRKSKGDYVMFVDGDDWVDPEMLEELYRVAMNDGSDFVTSGCVREDKYSGVKITDSIPQGKYSTDREKERIYSGFVANGGVDKPGVLYFLWAKLIKKELLSDLLERFPDNIKNGEDFAICFCACIRAKSITITHEVFYHYVMRDNSATHSRRSCYLKYLNENYLFICDNIITHAYYKVLKRQIDIWLMKSLLIGVKRAMGIDRSLFIPDRYIVYPDIPASGRIVLYGAGAIGQSVYAQIKLDESVRLVLWVDKSYEKYREMNMPVVAVEQIGMVEFDYIIIAVKDKELASSIRELLIREYHVCEDKIKWYEPRNILDKYIKTNDGI